MDEGHVRHPRPIFNAKWSQVVVVIFGTAMLSGMFSMVIAGQMVQTHSARPYHDGSATKQELAEVKKTISQIAHLAAEIDGLTTSMSAMAGLLGRIDVAATRENELVTRMLDSQAETLRRHEERLTVIEKTVIKK